MALPQHTPLHFLVGAGVSGSAASTATCVALTSATIAAVVALWSDVAESTSEAVSVGSAWAVSVGSAWPAWAWTADGAREAAITTIAAASMRANCQSNLMNSSLLQLLVLQQYFLLPPLTPLFPSRLPPTSHQRSQW